MNFSLSYSSKVHDMEEEMNSARKHIPFLTIQ